MGFKRLSGLLIALALVVGGLGLLRRSGSDSRKLHVCTWSNYFPESIVADFTAKTGISVEFSYITSNEELFAKLKAGATGYDLIQPSDYMVRQMVQLAMLQNINHAQLTELGNLDPFFRNLPYDEGLHHSVPFAWGTTGLAVNTEKVSLPPGPVSWSLLFESPDPKHTSLLDDMREVFAATFLWNLWDVNATDPALFVNSSRFIDAAKKKILMFSSEPRPLLINGELTIAHIFSTDGYNAHRENPHIRYFIPKEGATLWTDNFAIPVSSPRARQAHQFINYFLNVENAVNTILLNHSATPNRNARLRLPPELQQDPYLYPPEPAMKRLPLLGEPGALLPVMNRIWTELKS